MRLVNDFFSRKDINVNRQANIDYAKSLSIVFMILVHTFMHPEYYGLHTTIEGRIIGTYLGGFMAAPIFMTAMGFGIAFSRHSDSNQIIKRGIKFFLFSFLFNFVRALSVIIYLSINHASVEDNSFRMIRSVFMGDILGFVGLALILFGLLKKLKYHKFIIPAVAIIFTTIVTAVPPIYTDNEALSLILGYIFPIGGGFYDLNSFFPLFSWFIFVAFGYSFALIFRKVQNLDRFYLWCIIIGLILCIPFLTTEVVFDYGATGKSASVLQEYMNIWPDVILAIGFIMIDFGLFHFISKITNDKLDKFIFNMSNAINAIYVISWFIILNVHRTILEFIIRKESYDSWIYYVSFIIILIVSVALGIVWKNWKTKQKSCKFRF